MARRRRNFFRTKSGKKFFMGWGVLLLILGVSFLHQSTGFQGVEDYNNVASDVLPVLLVVGLPIFCIALYFAVKNRRKSKDDIQTPYR